MESVSLSLPGWKTIAICHQTSRLSRCVYCCVYLLLCALAVRGGVFLHVHILHRLYPKQLCSLPTVELSHEAVGLCLPHVLTGCAFRVRLSNLLAFSYAEVDGRTRRSEWRLGRTRPRPVLTAQSTSGGEFLTWCLLLAC